MSRASLARMGIALTAVAALAVHPAQAQDPGPGEKLGEKLDGAATTIKRAVGRAGETMKDQFERAKASINAMGVESRVYGRIRWDKALDKASIDVTAAKDGTVTLTGTVADLTAKAKAVQLAADTVGVSHVVDQLATASPSANP